MFLNGKVTYPTRILSTLRNVSQMLIPNPNKDDLDNLLIENPFFVEGIEVPSRIQIKNFIQNNIKVKNNVNRFNYADLAKWAINNRNIPIDDNEPFVIDDFIQIDDHHPELSNLRISISSKNLIGLAKKRKHICADATYKLIWQGINSSLIFSYFD